LRAQLAEEEMRRMLELKRRKEEEEELEKQRVLELERKRSKEDEVQEPKTLESVEQEGDASVPAVDDPNVRTLATVSFPNWKEIVHLTLELVD
jgi:hypothetical protein